VNADLVIEWYWTIEKEQICIQIGDLVDFRITIKDKERQRGGAGKIVFDQSPVFLGS